ncbi:SDR family NAD(P)-dependent oxidoreductase [Dyadobacter tibetensis]|uniref:SDR family NAD(P)-dependent oxidoreductase n=1 Tax=Dyadobacter tibetensis TaxID=1211851 RepID=UPI00046FB0AC|nr:SDR family oxidoreductase [Dyadobacter tibetensis]
MFSLDNKIAIITGGASGIGLAISQTFAKQGAFVHILELNQDLASQVAADIVRGGGKAQAHPVDVSDQSQVVKVVDAIAGVAGIDILVNNAGIAHVGKADTTSEEDFDRIYRVNIKGVYNCLFAALPHLKAGGGGVILNMASIAATVGITDRFAYSAAKGAVYSMTLSVARDYLADNIRCNSLSPARVHTPFVDGFIAKNYPGKEPEMFEKLSKSQPIGRMARPEEIGALALYLCSDEAGFVTGCDYLIDGGFEKLNN